ncbi:uncharacterized protein LOC108864448 [Galendromus occidentalis]|uniref:Uncharacterized protein LOC108864448 n=1 Tax=Galendromus occidentalis TaxID=34638 RepID=A0AAJ7WHW3_9ACAR|nr:uncharacterized protein LOC108864448 [Galendromus occidentalis]
MIRLRGYLPVFAIAFLFSGTECSLEVIDINLKDGGEFGPEKANVCAGQVYLLKLVGLNTQDSNSVEHAASVVGYPDLPRWNFIKPHKDDLLLYGSYPENDTLDVQIISTDQETFESTDRRFQLNVLPCRKPQANFEVEMKFMNYNIEDIFGTDVLQRLEAVMQNLWSSSQRVYVSKVASVLDVGGRKPIDPRDKEGFIVRFAAEQNFSSELRGLELEVRQLRNRVPCPRHYKRTSVEWRFRELGLAPDWCGFRLFKGTVAAQRVIPPEEIPIAPLPPFDGPDLDEMPRRTTTRDIFVSLLVPLVICFALLAGIGGTSLCLYSNDEGDGK